LLNLLEKPWRAANFVQFWHSESWNFVTWPVEFGKMCVENCGPY